MKIKKIYLKNYRNYDNLELDFSDNLNIIIGDNAQGKTNLLESIYVLAVTKSFLSINDKGLIKFNSRFAQIKGVLESNKSLDNLEIILNDNGKVVRINNKEIKKLSDYISKMNVIIFSTDNIKIFKDSPSSRRKYFNIQMSQMDNKYLKLLNDYNNLLRQRNEFLKIINIKKKSDMDYLDVLDDKYVSLSLEIYNLRKKYINDLNTSLDNYFCAISGLSGLKLKYISNVTDPNGNCDEQNLRRKIKGNLSKDMQYKMTLIGPNRDDFYFEFKGKNLSLFGSQGQIRSAVLSLKLSEVMLFTNKTHDKPILLLDDIFSELDIDRKNNVLQNLISDVQTIITTTDMENISEDIRKKANIYKIKDGKIISREIILKQEG